MSPIAFSTFQFLHWFTLIFVIALVQTIWFKTWVFSFTAQNRQQWTQNTLVWAFESI